ncbi:MAG TPA: gamma-aminobutyraldehyde dehydrogenase [Chloroflexota bacterium]|nr:gamma-aminobutyraldehyde dehydrogenase [Chloroflexota bacterium]
MVTATAKEYTMFVNGEWVPGNGGMMEIVNPATEEVVHRVPRATKEDVDRAVAAAREAFDNGSWSNLSPAERAGYLFKLADIIESRIPELARLETEETGKPITLSRDADFPFGLDNLRYFAGASRVLEGQATGEYVTTHTSMIRREPVGVIGQVAPWNYPFMMAIWKIGPALAAGNTVVLKPAENTPATTLEIARAVEEAGFPRGVFNVITGDEEAGVALTSHPDVDMVSLTGDSATGVKVMEQAAPTIKRLHLELGGKAPFVVFADADLEAAANCAAMAGTVNTGQDCTAATRIYVERPVFDEFADRLVTALKDVKVGDPLDEETAMGPLISKEQLDRVEGFVDRAREAGIPVAIGGKRADMQRGYYYEPTVVLNPPQDAEIVQREVFGPVLTVMPFDSEQEVLQKANGVDYGLAGSVWTSNVQRALNWAKKLNFGTVWINDHMPIASEMPHGGFKRSGFGKDMSMYALEDYTRIKHVMAELTGQAYKNVEPNEHEGV